MVSSRSRPIHNAITTSHRPASIDSGFDGLLDSQEKTDEASEFRPSTRLYLAFLTLAVITMAVALDGTSLSVALPVGILLSRLSL